MLPSTAVGTVEFRSLCEPIRVSNRFVEYVAATCDVRPHAPLRQAQNDIACGHVCLQVVKCGTWVGRCCVACSR
jgi:hypothetical protein